MFEKPTLLQFPLLIISMYHRHNAGLILIIYYERCDECCSKILQKFATLLSLNFVKIRCGCFLGFNESKKLKLVYILFKPHLGPVA